MTWRLSEDACAGGYFNESDIDELPGRHLTDVQYTAALNRLLTIAVVPFAFTM
ncbi:MAG: hypothetical protein GF401_17045 [Chitinivibrionales bacterium]|nr:hypothetical protein [Chitinivibrionales bacterium]